MKTLKLLSIATILLLGHCNKSSAPAIPTYTVKGKIIGTSFSYVLNNAPVSLTARSTQSLNYGLIVSGGTDQYGNYELTYNQVTGNYNELELNFGNIGNSLQGLPLNQNLVRNISSSDSGKVAIMLYTKNPLENAKDTLYLLGISSGNMYFVDTIISTVNGFYKEISFPKTFNDLYSFVLWSRINKGSFINNNSTKVNLYVSGNPFVDTLTINY